MEVAADGAVVFAKNAEEGRTRDGDVLNAEVVVVQMRAVEAGLDVLVDGEAIIAVPAGDQIAED